jgi:uncharacterized protein YkwD
MASSFSIYAGERTNFSISVGGLDVELFSELIMTRQRGCGGRSGALSPLRRDEIFDRVAQNLSNGADIQQAMREANSIPNGGAWIHMPLQKDKKVFLSLVSKAFCNDLLMNDWQEIGLHVTAKGAWIHIGKVFRLPDIKDFNSISSTALNLVNSLRSEGRKCGEVFFSPASSLSISLILNDVAIAHARDMAEKEYYSHIGLDGSKVSDRAKRAGYPSTFVSENNNIGPETIEKAISDWIISPEHCRNLMQSDVTDMGIGYAVNTNFRQGVLWVQVFGNPKK